MYQTSNFWKLIPSLFRENACYRTIAEKCMIKIFIGGRWWWHLQDTFLQRTISAFTHPPPFKLFWERFLNDPPPPLFKHLSLLPPAHPPPHPPQKKSFDCARTIVSQLSKCLKFMTFREECFAIHNWMQVLKWSSWNFLSLINLTKD